MRTGMILGGVLAVVGLGATFAGGGGDVHLVMTCYFYAAIFWTCLTLGCFGMTLFHNAIRARWSLGVIRFWEAGASNLWLMLLAFIPIFANLRSLYPWADPAKVDADPVMQHKQALLNPGMYIGMTVFFFAVWMLISFILNRSSAKQDVTGDINLANGRANLGAPGILIFVVTVTLATTMWVMSLDAKWFSTIWGFMFCAGMALITNAFGAIMLFLFRHVKPTADLVTPRITKDLGNMMLTFTVFWAYMGISQFLIIYSGNLPEENTYYITRLSSSWWGLGTFVLFGQFFLSFLFLLSGRTKRLVGLLAAVALWIFFMRSLDIFWIVMPFFYGGENGVPGTIFWLGPMAWLGLGGLWFVFYFLRLQRYPLVPTHEPMPVVPAVEHA